MRRQLLKSRVTSSRFLANSSVVLNNKVETTKIPLNSTATGVPPAEKLTGFKVTAPPTPPPVVSIPQTVELRKKRSFTGFLLKLALLGSILYGTTLYVATKNDKVMNLVIDYDLPYSEEIIDLIENGSYDDLVDKFEDIKSRLWNWEENSKERILKLTSKTEDVVAETKRKFGNKYISQTPAQQLQTPVEIEVNHPKVTKLPLLSTASITDPSVKSAITTFNDFIQSIDGSNVDSNYIKRINQTILELSNKLNGLTKSFNEKVDETINKRAQDLLSDYTKKELEITQVLLNQYHQEKSVLEQKLNETLQQEIKATQETISQAASNAVSLVRIEQTKKFEQLIQDKVNSEREGRLGNLNNLNERLQQVEKYAESLEGQLNSNHKKLQIHKILVKLKGLTLNYPENSSPKVLKPIINELESVSKDLDNDLIDLSLKELIPLIGNESTHSILSNGQLLSRWELLTPELRSASLLPPNAGLLGHLASGFFSKFLFPVKGNKVDGKDIESVIGRVEASLARGELDSAVEEVANLKGWPRKLSDDWVRAGRKRLEIEFLFNLIDSETKLL